MRMHTDQVDVSANVVAALVAEQFPQWRALPVRPLASTGTVNALFRLGTEIVLRFPLLPTDPELHAELRREQEYAELLTAHLPVAVPEPLGLGEPGAGYAGPWTAYRFIPGETAQLDRIGDPDTFARDLAGVVTALRGIDTGGRAWPGFGRGGPLVAQDAGVRSALALSGGLTDTGRLAEVWDRCRDTPGHDAAVWVHADLMPGNLLVRDGRLAAVIDLETVNVGDPAVDLMPAWNLLDAEARETYRRALGVDDAMWERGRGWALVQAINALPYYIETNPVMAGIAQHTLRAVLD
ncbi:aminoglycoside phosphotransferase (APT) family kinase protein [Micromonospora luteifusca]|uniref:Aminoglycoside phosphotransferase (APT) family kinase protein n=1 Tax=Micromonospora luteifusca TaxID=709860 RepID=A0ABS2LZL4_9ACTN|nr:aminoglycoside phosphotransferase family protein [Micromonospora luteifusca]MBM7493653.1 aminoglycoside phosphotransferase (APT) family kinase protein [Micromonospora luteifusca]